MPERFESFAEFYPYYLTEHSDRSCRRLHFIGTALVMLTLIVAVVIGISCGNAGQDEGMVDIGRAHAIVEPVTVRPEQSVQEALDVMAHFHISGLPVIHTCTAHLRKV